METSSNATQRTYLRNGKQRPTTYLQRRRRKNASSRTSNISNSLQGEGEPKREGREKSGSSLLIMQLQVARRNRTLYMLGDVPSMVLSSFIDKYYYV